MADFYFEYEAEHKIFAVRVTGRATDEVFKAAYDLAVRCLEGREVRAALIDLTSVEQFSISASGVRKMSAERPLFPGPTPRYIIASEAHVFGMARMYQIVASKGREALHVVRSVKDAYDALGLGALQFERLT